MEWWRGIYNLLKFRHSYASERFTVQMHAKKKVGSWLLLIVVLRCSVECVLSIWIRLLCGFEYNCTTEIVKQPIELIEDRCNVYTETQCDFFYLSSLFEFKWMEGKKQQDKNDIKTSHHNTNISKVQIAPKNKAKAYNNYYDTVASLRHAKNVFRVVVVCADWNCWRCLACSLHAQRTSLECEFVACVYVSVFWNVSDERSEPKRCMRHKNKHIFP